MQHSAYTNCFTKLYSTKKQKSEPHLVERDCEEKTDKSNLIKRTSMYDVQQDVLIALPSAKGRGTFVLC